jgi:uncharacterized protein (TIGR03083 family)
MADRAFIDQLEMEWATIGALGHELNDDDWARHTDCPGWTVKDQLSHIVGTESMLLGRNGPPAAPAGLPHVHNPIGEMNEAWVESLRPEPGAKVLAAFEEVTTERLAALRAMTDDELEREGPSPIGPVPYGIFMQVRVFDCWVHEQDIRRAVGHPGNLEGPVAEVAMGRLSGGFGFVVGKRVGPPDGTTVVVRVTGPLARTLAVEMKDGRARPIEPPASPTLAVDIDAESFACLAAGRWVGGRVLAEGRATITGDEELGHQLLANFATIP